jgi:hypothetical protein
MSYLCSCWFTCLQEGACLGTRSLIHVPEKFTTIAKNTPHKHGVFDKPKDGHPQQAKVRKPLFSLYMYQNVADDHLHVYHTISLSNSLTLQRVRLYCLHQNVYHRIRCFVTYDETVRRRKLLASVDILSALRGYC